MKMKSKSMRLSGVAGALVGLLALAGCSSESAVIVLTEQGSPVDGAIVSPYTVHGPLPERKTNIFGRAKLAGKDEKGKLTGVSVSKYGYEPVTAATDGKDDLVVTLFFVK